MTGQRLDMTWCDNLSLALGGNVKPLETVGVFDGKSMMPPDSPHLDGTVALDAFAGRVLAFSYSKSTLTLLEQEALDRLTKQHSAVPVHIVRDAEGIALSVSLPVITPKGIAWFELDSGNVSPFLLVGSHL